MQLPAHVAVLSCTAAALLASACRSTPRVLPSGSAPAGAQEVRHEPERHDGLVHGLEAMPVKLPEVAALARELQALEAQYRERAEPELERRHAQGQYEVVATDGRLLPEHLPPGEVASAFLQPRGEVRKVTLPREDFPELYELRTRLDALRTQLARARSAATPALGETL